MPATTTQAKTWQEALESERERIGYDEVVLLYLYEPGSIGAKAHIYVEEGDDPTTRCEVGRSPNEWIAVTLDNLSAKLTELGLPVDGWS